MSRLTREVAAGEDAERVVGRARAIIATLPERDRIAILDAHPRIGADARTLSSLSRAEQGEDTDAETMRELAALNEAYERRFGFRFVVFVAGRSKRELVTVLRERLLRQRDAELATGLEEYLAISRDRLRRAPPRPLSGR